MRASSKQIPLNLEAQPAFSRESYLISPSNEAALAMIDKWPDWSAPALVLSGPAASGKSHLAAIWARRAGAAGIRSEMLSTHSAQALAETSQNIVLDGIDPWLGDSASETTLFHLYNIFKEEKRSLLITMRIPPSNAPFIIKDLASRLRAAPLAIIHPPDDALLSSIFLKLFQDRQVNVGEDVIPYLIPRIERSFLAVQTIVAFADKKALAEKRPISVPLMREVLTELQ